MLGLLNRGIFLNPDDTTLYVSLAHGKASCDEFLACFAETLGETTHG